MLRSDLERFIIEDLGEWDDSSSIVPEIGTSAFVIAKEDCIISGLAEARDIFDYFGLTVKFFFDDGEFVSSGNKILSISGNAIKVLQSERLALNFLSRMSGISTLTRECVMRAKAAGICVRIAATRKTTPGFRFYEKKAVYLGGGDTHRFNLSDSVIIKDNHIQILGLEECLKCAKKKASFTKKIEVEVENLSDMLLAAEGGADIIMFDNMDPAVIKKGVEMLEKKGLRLHLLLEASGGISLQNIEDFAVTGVDIISLGALTKNARWIDLSLDIEQNSQ